MFEERDERAAEEAITMSPEDRQRLERKLVRKLDARFSMCVSGSLFRTSSGRERGHARGLGVGWTCERAAGPTRRAPC